MKKHTNILYTLVILLIVFQITSFVFVSIQFTKLNTELRMQTNALKKELSSDFTQKLNKYDEINQENINSLSIAISQQQQEQESFKREIKMLKISQEDISAIVEDAVKGVVAVMTENSVGSGFIITSDGFVVTNYHVLQRGDEIRVLTYDKEALPATIVGIDRLHDLALLKVEGEFYNLEFADSDQLQVGRTVIAIGNPLGLSFTVTEGIISALDREGPNGIEEYIQTDVSLNPGNSGGPLLDTEGKVVGMNNFKIGGAESLGFALESNSIKNSVNALLGKEVM